MIRYAYFYPENNNRVSHHSYATKEEAIAYYPALSQWWSQIEVQAPSDIAAFVNAVTGVIVVLRKIEK